MKFNVVVISSLTLEQLKTSLVVRKVISRSRETRAISRSARIRQKALLSFCLDRPLELLLFYVIYVRERMGHTKALKRPIFGLFI